MGSEVLKLEDGTDCGTAIWMMQKGVIYASPVAAALYNIRPDTALAGFAANLAMDAVHQDDVQQVRRIVREHIETGTFLSIRYRVHSANGLKSVQVEGQCLRDAEGAPLAFPTTISDVTGTCDAIDRMESLGDHLLEAYKISSTLQLKTAAYSISLALTEWETAFMAHLRH